LRRKFGSWAIFAAMRRASSRVSSLPGAKVAYMIIARQQANQDAIMDIGVGCGALA
jgi:hypothetical protein